MRVLDRSPQPAPLDVLVVGTSSFNRATTAPPGVGNLDHNDDRVLHYQVTGAPSELRGIDIDVCRVTGIQVSFLQNGLPEPPDDIFTGSSGRALINPVSFQRG